MLLPIKLTQFLQKFVFLSNGIKIRELFLGLNMNNILIIREPFLGLNNIYVGNGRLEKSFQSHHKKVRIRNTTLKSMQNVPKLDTFLCELTEMCYKISYSPLKTIWVSVIQNMSVGWVSCCCNILVSILSELLWTACKSWTHSACA